MRMYFFDVTVRVEHRGLPIDPILYKGARACDELTARRLVLNQYLKSGFRVVRLDRVDERVPRATLGL